MIVDPKDIYDFHGTLDDRNIVRILEHIIEDTATCDWRDRIFNFVFHGSFFIQIKPRKLGIQIEMTRKVDDANLVIIRELDYSVTDYMLDIELRIMISELNREADRLTSFNRPSCLASRDRFYADIPF